ncbi:Protein kinase-like domain protein [Niveomyces insectorum RCEF 264]|uniref:EKC/KEOPS complex subunit BUD32 n=1 Tax=Niveomyces insectorum RCEF 264 TaxID=1081102 RepID=A0A167MG34_9HYPO|nr:Protein kinase-like domain protein [Niveomyces insectorum RCEF 264]
METSGNWLLAAAARNRVKAQSRWNKVALIAAAAPPRPWTSLVLRGDEDSLEQPRRYRPGGFHPVRLDERLDDGRYRVLHKLGHGGFSTVWLCQDMRYHQQATEPRYVAVKILRADAFSASESHSELLICNLFKGACMDDRRLTDEEADHILLPLNWFYQMGPNGTHLCLVFPLMGPTLMDARPDLVEKAKDAEGNDNARDMRVLLHQVAEGLATLHRHGICHGDLRPSNVLLKLNPLDGMETDELIDLLGEPETADVVLRHRDARQDRVFVPEIPPYLVYAACFDMDTNIVQTERHVCIADFGQSFDTTTEPFTRWSGIPRPYSAPELVFGKAGGTAMDLWALGCLLFEARMGAKIIEPADVMAPNDDEYCISVCLLLGKLPEPWWTNWKERDEHFEPATGLPPHSPLVLRPRSAVKHGSAVAPPRSVREAITSSCYRPVWERSRIDHYEKIQDIADEEADLLADLIEKLLRYTPEDRIPAQSVVEHAWFRWTAK